MVGVFFMNVVKYEMLFMECVEKINLWIDWEKLKVKWKKIRERIILHITS